MKLLILAVGQGIPAWAQDAVQEYARRFPPDWRLEIHSLRAEPRGSKTTPPIAALLRAEHQRIRALLAKTARSSSGLHTVALDERGQSLSTRALACKLQAWQERLGQSGSVALVIGGPDGLDPDFKQSAHERLRLSDLTLPHALARVLLVEQLYRAWSILDGHPYHRE